MEKYEVKLDVTEKDYINLYMAKYFANFTKVLGMAAMVLLFVLVLLYYIFIDRTFYILALSAVPMLMYGHNVIKLVPQNAREDYPTTSYKTMKPSFSLDRRGVILLEKSSGKISEIRLQDLNSAWKKKGYFYFSITKNNTVIVPKRLLSSEEIEFTEDMISTLPASQRRNPNTWTLRKLLWSVFTYILVVVCIIMVLLSITGKLL